MKRFRDQGVAPEMDELWEKIFGDSYATGEYCVVPGMDVSVVPAANASTNPTFYERQGNSSADQDTPMGEHNPLATELMEVDPGFFRNLYIRPGEGGSSSSTTTHGPSPTTTAPNRTTHSSQFSSPPTSSTSDSKRPRLSRSATMVHEAINELREEG